MTDIDAALRESQNVALRESINILEQGDWGGFATSLREILAAREYSKQREDELLRAVKAAAHAAFDYATESDEHGDRFAMWWGVYSHEALAENGDSVSGRLGDRGPGA